MDVMAAVNLLKYDDPVLENALNLTVAAPMRYQAGIDTAENTMEEMRARFQQWVLEMYKDASKTKTITTKKYERIMKTLAGEIKNCAENSKFRFWMKSKGFKLETQADGEKLLLVQDKKGDEIKYKKVAVVENFFDIIYKVHVNKGAREIQHAGQKRTHRTITETYAFLPREAVTKFLLCCAECQKRTYEEQRKPSPNSSSCNSIHECMDGVLITTQPTNILLETAAPPLLPLPLNYSTTEHIHMCEQWKPPMAHYTDYDNNNCANRDQQPANQQPAEPFNFLTKPEAPEINSTPLIRKRKRIFTKKIIRHVIEPQEVDYRQARDENQVPAIDFLHRSINEHLQTPTTCSFDRKSSNQQQYNQTSNKRCKIDDNYQKGSNLQNCPYVTKLSQLLYNPAKYAEDNETNDSTPYNEDFMETLAVNLIVKARRLEAVKEALTSHEKQQLSLKVYSCRISSFLLNYVADLMLKTAVADSNFQHI